jgi:hypothetical protein
VATSLDPFINEELDTLSVEVGIRWDLERPVETDYRKWNDYWSALSDFILLKYKHTGCRK